MNSVRKAPVRHWAVLTRVLGRLLALVVALTTMAIVAAPASAGTPKYCGRLVAPYSQCWHHPGIGNWQSNFAIYGGAGTVSVCEKGVVAVDGRLISRRCANRQVSDAYDFMYNTYLNGIQTIPTVGNNSQWDHTIHGETTDCWGCNPTVATSAPASLKAEMSAFETANDGSTQVPTLRAGGETVSLSVTTKDWVCIAASEHGGKMSCATRDEAVNGDLQTTIVCSATVPSDRVLIYGVVPDDAVEVVAYSENGNVTPAMSKNTYRFDLAKSQARTISGFAWIDRAGDAHSINPTLPRDDLGCGPESSR